MMLRFAQMKLRQAANDVLRNDVGLRPTVLRYAQTDFSENKKMPNGIFEQGSRNEPLTTPEMGMQVLLDTVKYNVLYIF